MSILVLNAGSSTLKYAVFRHDDLAIDDEGCVDVQGSGDAYHDAAAQVFRQIKVTDLQAVGHRVVHGGSYFSEPVLIDTEVMATIGSLSALAPLHNPPALAVIKAAQENAPGVSQFAVFDTAFFSDLPQAAQVYPLPYEWYEKWGVRRYGFHGISHAYCAHQAAAMLDRKLQQLRLVICHLGNGCSASAVQNGRAVATTMGFTPLEGLMMGSRSGSVDPGILLFLLKTGKASVNDLEETLLHKSGLLGVSGVSADIRKIQAAATAGNERSQLALDIFVDRVRGAIGSLAASMGGIDALIFTAGIGEHRAGLRQLVCDGLSWAGCELDPDKNEQQEPDADISAAHATVRVLVIHTRENLQICREVRRIRRIHTME